MARPITVVETTWVGAQNGVDGLVVIVNPGTVNEITLAFSPGHGIDVGESMMRQARGMYGAPLESIETRRACPFPLDA